jgi:hypothetical protein
MLRVVYLLHLKVAKLISGLLLKMLQIRKESLCGSKGYLLYGKR